MRTCSLHHAYALWAPHYPPLAHNQLMEVEQAAVTSLLPPLAGAVALDAACGTGRYLRLLAAHGARRAYGVDSSQPMLRQFRTPNMLVGDLHALPFADGTVDVVVCGLAINDLPALGPPMRELARVLRPHGVLVCSSLHPRGADAQWRRTFEAEGRTWALPAHWHSLDDHRRACAAAGLRIDAVREPALAGRGPVALVIRASRS